MVAGWKPVCDGALADALRAAVLEVAAALRPFHFEDPSLSGAGGAAVLHAYLDRELPGQGWGEASEQGLARGAAGLTRVPVGPALFGGFSGLAWCVEHLGASSDDPDASDDVDDALAVLLERGAASFDLLNGLVGIGVYLLERAAQPRALAGLGRIVERLAAMAERRDDGLTWKTPPEALGPARAQHPGGYYNLGLAHGVPGVIVFLARACTVPPLAARARALLEGAVAWLRSRRLAGGFPCLDGAREPARSAWCYGDPGVAAALLQAARVLEDGALAHEAVALALCAAARVPEATGVVDASLCHGSAGLAHIFGRFHGATGEPRFAVASRAWFERTLAQRVPGTGVAGFTAHLPDGSVPPACCADLQAGFLVGATGVALAMLGGVSQVEPAWDRVLGVALGPGAAGAPVSR